MFLGSEKDKYLEYEKSVMDLKNVENFTYKKQEQIQPVEVQEQEQVQEQ